MVGFSNALYYFFVVFAAIDFSTARSLILSPPGASDMGRTTGDDVLSISQGSLKVFRDI